MKRKAPIKMYQMGTPNLVPQGTQKAVMDTVNNVSNNFQNANQNLVNKGMNLGQNMISANQDIVNKGINFGKNYISANKEMLGKAGNMAQDFIGAQKNMYGKALGAIGNKLFNKGTNSVKGKTKKYDGGISFLSSLATNPEMVNSGNAALQQLATTSSSTIPTGQLPASGNISDLVKAGTGAASSGKGGLGAASSYANLVPAIAGMVMPYLLKKEDRTQKPYKKGTKMIKYQDGNENLQATKGVKDFIKYLEENERNISNSSIPKEVAEKFDISSVADVMPDISKRSPKGSNIPNDTQVGPTRKEMADLLRAYNKKERAAGRLGYIDMGEADRMYEQNEAMMGNKINRVPGKIETLSGKTPLIKLASTPELPEKVTGVPVEKQSRRERKKENRRLEALAKTPIIYNESSFVGPSNEELQLSRIRKDAESARNTYEARLAGESARSAYEAKQKENASTFKRTDFKDMTPAQQKQYRAGMASGREFTVEGIGKYAAASKEEQAQSARMAAKSRGAKPLIKMKENPYIKDGKVIKDYTTIEGLRVYHNTEGPSRIYNPKTGKKGKYEYNPKTDKFGIRWDTNKAKGKTAKHTSEDSGEKMVNPIIENSKGKTKDISLGQKLNILNYISNLGPSPYQTFASKLIK